MTRIISGSLRGKRIVGPKNEEVRPTTDRAKEALFNILTNRFYFDEIKALDLFGGLGSLSYELCSRGCESVCCVEGNPRLARFIEQTAAELKMDQLTVYSSEVLRFIERDFSDYDLILADPPFDFTFYDNLVEKIFLHHRLRQGSLLVVEHQSRLELSHLSHYQNTRKYGNVAFSFFDPDPRESP